QSPQSAPVSVSNHRRGNVFSSSALTTHSSIQGSAAHKTISVPFQGGVHSKVLIIAMPHATVLHNQPLFKLSPKNRDASLAQPHQPHSVATIPRAFTTPAILNPSAMSAAA